MPAKKTGRESRRRCGNGGASMGQCEYGTTDLRVYKPAMYQVDIQQVKYGDGIGVLQPFRRLSAKQVQCRQSLRFADSQ